MFGSRFDVMWGWFFLDLIREDIIGVGIMASFFPYLTLYFISYVVKKFLNF